MRITAKERQMILAHRMKMKQTLAGFDWNKDARFIYEHLNITTKEECADLLTAFHRLYIEATEGKAPMKVFRTLLGKVVVAVNAFWYGLQGEEKRAMKGLVLAIQHMETIQDNINEVFYSLDGFKRGFRSFIKTVNEG